MRIVFISDTHNCQGFDVPAGDVLVHCGDFTMRGLGHEISAVNDWLCRLPHEHKLVVAGNHDIGFEDAPKVARRLLTAATYLQDEAITIAGVNFYGSPWQPWFDDWAFNFPQHDGGEMARNVWSKIPKDTDVLVTHGPPRGILDLAPVGGHVGCPEMLERIGVVKPKIHAFGHIHCAAGVEQHDGTLFVNASICDEKYKPTQPARVIDLVAGVTTLVDA
jgi:Icc-related predicted phosphoesterase